MIRKSVDVIVIEVDMAKSSSESCQACDVAKQQLSKALEVVEPILRDVNAEVRVNNVVVSTEDQAHQLRFRGSPTLRVGEFEVVPTHVLGSEERKWLWGRQEHSVPPIGLFVDAILRGWAGTEQESSSEQYTIPDYLTPYLTKTSAAPGTSCSTCG